MTKKKNRILSSWAMSPQPQVNRVNFDFMLMLRMLNKNFPKI